MALTPAPTSPAPSLGQHSQHSSGSTVVFADVEDDALAAEPVELLHPRHLSTRSEDLGTASRFSAMSRCETDPELMKMGQAMTIKVAMADAIGEESDEEEREVSQVCLPGHPIYQDHLQCISPDGSPVSLRRSSPCKSPDKTPEGFGLPAMKPTKSVRSVGSRRSGASRRLPSRSCGDLSQVGMTPRRTKSAKNFRRGRKRVMVAAMNAKMPTLAHAAERPPPEALLAFLRGFGPGPGGADLDSILAWSLDRWENQHNYIQWLFPTDEESEYHPEAPVLTPEVQEEMLIDPMVEDNLIRCFEKFLQFLGLDYAFDEDIAAPCSPVSEEKGQKHEEENEERKLPVTVTKGESFRKRRVDCWVVNCPEGNHNWFRISRVLVSLRLLGLIDEAEAFYLCLEKLWANGDLPGFAIHSMRIWRESAGLEKRILPKRRKKPRGPCACVIC
ncbi:unnamed protein product [Cladocopium goreaui]|uniref:Opioid growth factor receptor (OGFr) conserved domain-containing protein n=1 Tax=Cladocopium goreaui TaxID=2562237 RepID=A0A9P1CLC6_9DINO|nr:unnamed protein product [Cladocopium goreaui]